MIFSLVYPLLVINISYLTNDFSPCGSSIGNKHILSDCNDFPLVSPLLVINISYLTVMIFSLVDPLLVVNISYLTVMIFFPCGSSVGNKHILLPIEDPQGEKPLQ